MRSPLEVRVEGATLTLTAFTSSLTKVDQHLEQKIMYDQPAIRYFQEHRPAFGAFLKGIIIFHPRFPAATNTPPPPQYSAPHSMHLPRSSEKRVSLVAFEKVTLTGHYLTGALR